MSGGALLPRHSRLTRLFDQAPQAHLHGSQEFGIAGLHQRRQQDIEGSIGVRSGQDPIGDRIDL